MPTPPPPSAQRVLLTGGFGLVGRWVIRELLRQGFQVTVLEQDTPRTRSVARGVKGVDVAWCDLRQADAVASAVQGHHAVIHLACVLPPLAEEQPELAFAVNVEGTQNIVDACLAQPRPPRLVHGSSGEVYGATRHLDPPRRVGDPLAAVNHYSAHKIEAEARVQASGLDHIILRFSAVIDIALASSHPLMFEFPVDVRMQVIHAADAALAVVNCLTAEAAWGRELILPVAGGEGCRTTYGAFVNRMLETMGVGALPEQAFTREDYPSDWHDTELSQALLGYQRHSLDDICADVHALLGWRGWFVPLVRPLVRYGILRGSSYL